MIYYTDRLRTTFWFDVFTFVCPSFSCDHSTDPKYQPMLMKLGTDSDILGFLCYRRNIYHTIFSKFRNRNFLKFKMLFWYISSNMHRWCRLLYSQPLPYLLNNFIFIMCADIIAYFSVIILYLQQIFPFSP